MYYFILLICSYSFLQHNVHYNMPGASTTSNNETIMRWRKQSQVALIYHVKKYIQKKQYKHSVHTIQATPATKLVTTQYSCFRTNYIKNNIITAISFKNISPCLGSSNATKYFPKCKNNLLEFQPPLSCLPIPWQQHTPSPTPAHPPQRPQPQAARLPATRVTSPRNTAMKTWQHGSQSCPGC